MTTARRRWVLLLAVVALGLAAAGCTPTRPPPIYAGVAQDDQARRLDAPRPASLFPADRAALSDADVRRILDAEVTLPDSARVALLEYSAGTALGYGYYSPAEQQLREQQVRALQDAVRAADRVASVVFLPSLLTPEAPSVASLREAALRVQADAALLFRTESDLFREVRFFRSDRLHAYSTVEVVLLDVRTGLIPFAHLATRDVVTQKQDGDRSDAEARQRATGEATQQALTAAAEALRAFLDEPQ